MVGHRILSMTDGVSLRAVWPGDLLVFFEQQLDPEATRMAAFAPRDQAAFMAHWQNLLVDRKTVVRAIDFRGALAGNLVCWEASGECHVGYWLGKRYWGQGIATAALTQFLNVATPRPLHARAARRNAASVRVLQKCGFTIVGEDAFRGPDGAETAEFVLVLR
jgi:RimJ/RimL family protein N-acetyltransferase